jgi:iron-sulfur cluster repair protein YtfE (RIC family)
MNMPTTQSDLDCTATVHDLIQSHPTTRAVFHRFGVDTCCGSLVSVEQAARRDGLDATVLCAALRAAVQEG